MVIGAQVTGGDRGSGYWWVIGAQVTGGDRGSGYWW